MPSIYRLSISGVQGKWRHLVLFTNSVSSKNVTSLDSAERTCKPPSFGLIGVRPPEGIDLVRIKKAVMIEQVVFPPAITTWLAYCLWKKGVMPRPRNNEYIPTGPATAKMPVHSIGWRVGILRAEGR